MTIVKSKLVLLFVFLVFSIIVEGEGVDAGGTVNLTLTNGIWDVYIINNTINNQSQFTFDGTIWILNTSINSTGNPTGIFLNLTEAKINILENNFIDLTDTSGNPNINVTFNNSYIYGDYSVTNKSFLRFTNTNVWIDNSTFQYLGNNASAGSEFRGIYLKNLANKFNNNINSVIKDSRFIDGIDCLQLDDQSNFSIYNNNFSNCNYGALQVTFGFKLDIFNNTINNVTTQNGIDLAWVNDTNVYSNRVYNTGHNSYAFRQFSQRINIYNNYAENTTHHLYDFFLENSSCCFSFYNNIGYNTIDSNAVYLKNVTNSSFINSSFYNFNLYGISIDGITSNLTLSNLNFYSNQSTSAGVFSRDVNNSNYYSILTNTYLTGFSLVKNDNLLSSSINRFYNLTNALVYFDNKTVIGSPTISNNDGNINITLPPGNYSYILDNYQVTELTTRQNDPISFTSSSPTQKVINSSLTNGINTTLILDNIDFSDNPVNVTIASSIRTQNFYGGWTETNNTILTLETVQIDPGINNISIIYASGGSGSSGGSSSCTPSWQCSEWGICNSDSIQYRTCTDLNSCGLTTDKPSESQGCLNFNGNFVNQTKTILNDIKSGNGEKYVPYILLGIGAIIITWLIISSITKNNSQANYNKFKR